MINKTYINSDNLSASIDSSIRDHIFVEIGEVKIIRCLPISGVFFELIIIILLEVKFYSYIYSTTVLVTSTW